MHHRAAKAFVIGRTARRCRNTQSVAAEHFEGNIIDIHLDDHCSVNTLKGELIQCNMRSGTGFLVYFQFKQRIPHDARLMGR
ncbi:hypothetical protein D3C81_1647350 [compost metagenome]